MTDPGKPGEIGLLLEDQIGQGPPTEVGGGDTVARRIHPEWPIPVVLSNLTDGCQSRGTATAPPHRWVMAASPRSGKRSQRILAMAS